jgi:hypothetical protein
MRILDREREEAQKRRRADSEREMRREARWGPRKRYDHNIIRSSCDISS